MSLAIVIILYILGILSHFAYRFWEWSEANPLKNIWDYFIKFKRHNIVTIIIQVMFGGWWIGQLTIGGITISETVPVNWALALVMGWVSDSYVKANIHKVPVLKSIGDDSNGGKR